MRLVQIFRDAAARAWHHDAPQLGAALSYYALVSLIPLLMIAVTLAGFALGEDQARAELRARAEAVSGPELTSWIDDSMRDVSLTGSRSLRAALSLAALAWSAALLFGSLRDALNVVWDVRSERRWVSRFFFKTVTSYALVTACGVLLIVSMATTALLGGLARLLPETWHESVAALWWPDLFTSFLLTYFVLLVLYKVLPETRVRWRDVRLGALAAALLLLSAKLLIGLYVTHSAKATAFGAASSLFVVLVWVYGGSQIFLFGAELCCLSARRGGPSVTR